MTQQQPYDVLRSFPHFEVRRYPAHLLAEVEVDASFTRAGNEAFGVLVGYISGRNSTRGKVAMTAPVLQQQASTTIEMTSPVVQQPIGESGRYIVAFVMPSEFTLDTLPTPSDPRITVHEVPAHVAAVKSFTGRWTSTPTRSSCPSSVANLSRPGLRRSGSRALPASIHRGRHGSAVETKLWSRCRGPPTPWNSAETSPRKTHAPDTRPADPLACSGVIRHRVMLRSDPNGGVSPPRRRKTMNRSLVSPVVAVLAALALAACSGTPADTTDATSSDAPTTAAAPVETTVDAAPSSQPAPAPATSSDAAVGAEQSVAQACLSVAGPISEAAEKMSEIASVVTTDPQSAVDTWSALVEAYESVAGTVTNAEVKAAATAVRDDLATLRDAMQKVYVDLDMAAMSEFTDATAEWQASQTELQALCTEG